MHRRIFLLLIMLLIPLTSYAALNLELTQGVAGAIPIAVVPFKWQGQAKQIPQTKLSAVIHSDLQNSGRFNVTPSKELQQFPSSIASINYGYWRNKLQVNDIVIGRIKPLANKKYQVEFELLNMFRDVANHHNELNNVLAAKKYTVNFQQLRRLAHHISNIVYHMLTGQRGAFATRIAYVLKKSVHGKLRYQLMIADTDGYNPHKILVSEQPIMSPSWSSDGKYIAYVSFEKGKSQIYVSNIYTGHRKLITNYPGINSAPTWSPNGKRLALVLSKSGNPNIYIYQLHTGKLTRVTRDWSIDTEPSWSPNGQRLLFTSNRSGGPQIYEINLPTGQIQRITFTGNYNAHATFAPNAKDIVFMHCNKGICNIAKQNLANNQVTMLTNKGMNESPSIAPNGSMVIFATENDGNSILQEVSIDGRVHIRLPSTSGKVQEPAWSPFLG